MPSQVSKISSMNLKEYSLSEFFYIKRGNGLSRSELYKDATGVNFISRQSFNNGVNAIVKEIEGISPFPAGCITVALGGEYLGSSFIQMEPFYTAAHIAVLFPKEKNMSNNIKWFICSLIRFEAKNKFCAFGRELDTYIDNRLKIKLPSKSDGKPDWSKIEQYMKSLEKGLDTQMHDIIDIAQQDINLIKIFANKVEINDFKAWATTKANKKNAVFTSLDDVNWAYFKVGKLFDIRPTKMYKDLGSNALNDGGNTQFVVNSSMNNGIGGMSSLEPTEEGNIITYSDTTDGNTFFYHDKPFIGFAHVQGMYPKGFALNKNRALFLIGIFNFSNKGLYDYNRKFRRDRFMDTEIYLPVDDQNNPNWEWIERYIESLPYSDG